jgi:hypothetical protein
MTLRVASGRTGVGVVALVVALSGCGLFRGAVNASPGIRWWLFSTFGAEKMCPEMLKRGAPLRLTPNGNTIGRFFPNACRYTLNDAQQTMTISFGGTGFAWTPVAGRVGFAMDAAVEYRPDFQLAEDAVYVWAKTNRVISGPTFSLGSVENPVVDWATRTPVGYLANTFGGQIVQSNLASGFTVVRTDQGDDFSLGILMPPERPQHPFKMDSDERLMLANETTEVRAGQVDFVGPLEVGESDQALYLRFSLQGSPVDVMVFQRASIESWREALQKGAPLAPPPVPPFAGLVVQPGVELRQKLRLPQGHYFMVVDNSNRIGNVAPPWSPLNMLGGGVALLSYSVELGDAE